MASGKPSDETIIGLYWNRSEEALALTKQKYGRYLWKIARNILTGDADADEIENDTYLRLWNTIPPQKPLNFRAYAGTLCRRLALDRYEAEHARKRNGNTEQIDDEISLCFPEDIGDTLALSELLDRFLRGLPDKKRRIFLRRYYYMSSVREIAQDFSMKESAVTMVLLRLREQLSAYLKKEGYTV